MTSLRRLLAGLLLLLALAAPALAISDPREALPDPAQEQRAVALGSQLRCLVCQNESIEDSGADLARDLRAIVRQRIAAGDSDAQVMAWMTSRYGDFVRLRPRFDAATALLWLSPVLALALAALLLLRRQAAAPPPPLSAAEQQRLDRLTREDG
jgi:cytochrome c-type biogenesis protein CcmH